VFGKSVAERRGHNIAAMEFVANVGLFQSFYAYNQRVGEGTAPRLPDDRLTAI